jgi:fumarate hydratase class I
MGFGGKTTVLGVKIGSLDRLPASYFVSVSYMCWANRRAAARIDAGGNLEWLN